MLKLGLILCMSLACSAVASDTGTFPISGITVDSLDGSPLAQCEVAIRPDPPPAGSSSTVTVITKEDGRFNFAGLSAGKYSMFARCVNHRIQPLDQHGNYASAVAVGRGKPSENLIFRMEPSAAITGVIVDEYADPVADAKVHLFRRGPESGRLATVEMQDTTTNAEGIYHFFGLPSGEYFVVVVARPWYAGIQGSPPPARSTQRGNEADLNLAYPVTYYPSVTSESAATPIRLHPGDRYVADMTLTAQPANFLSIPSGLQDGDIPPAEQQLQVSVFGSRLQLDVPIGVDDSGKTLVYSGISPGQYTLQTDPNEASPQTASRKQLSITDDGGVEYQKPVEAVAVTGKVQLQGARVSERERFIRFYRQSGQENFIDAHWDEQGTLAPFHLFPGTYQFSSPSGAVIKNLQAQGAKVIGSTIKVGATPVALSVTIADMAGELRGTVLAENNVPLPGAMVILIPEDAQHNEVNFRRDQSDLDGTFTLRAVPPGKYSLIAITDGWELEWLKPDVLQRFLPKAKPLEVLLARQQVVTVSAQSAK